MARSWLRADTVRARPERVNEDGGGAAIEFVAENTFVAEGGTTFSPPRCGVPGCRECGGENPNAPLPGRQLFEDMLTPEQVASFDQHGYFEVTPPRSRRCFRIRWGDTMNILEIKDGITVRQWCVVPQASLPGYDILVAQKLLLEADFKRFLNTAVKHR